MPEVLNILACQIAVGPTDDAAARDKHVALLCERIAAAASHHAYDVIVLPELSTIEYSNSAFHRIDHLSENAEGSSYKQFSALARRLQCAVVFGFARKAANGTTICQAVLGPDGSMRGYYDKLHLAQFGQSAEAAAFKPGEHLCLRFAKIAQLCFELSPQLSTSIAQASQDRDRSKCR